jgi:AhpD family alkylhydroperoxidase
MPSFEVHSIESAPEKSKPLLKHAQQTYGGMIPNIHAVMAESPALLEAYGILGNMLAGSSLDMAEQNIVWLTVNFENDCHYCMAAHTVVARHAGLSEIDIDALRAGTPLANPRHEALRRFTAKMVRERGWLSEPEVDALLQAGYTRETALDVVLGIGMKTLSNYTNHLANTPVDAAFASSTWEDRRLEKIRLVSPIARRRPAE